MNSPPDPSDARDSAPLTPGEGLGSGGLNKIPKILPRSIDLAEDK